MDAEKLLESSVPTPWGCRALRRPHSDPKGFKMNSRTLKMMFVLCAFVLGTATAAFAGDKVTICHNSGGKKLHEIEVSVNALQAHLDHGLCLDDDSCDDGSMFPPICDQAPGFNLPVDDCDGGTVGVCRPAGFRCNRSFRPVCACDGRPPLGFEVSNENCAWAAGIEWYAFATQDPTTGDLVCPPAP